jgi:predicted HAD superfamily hydrolase
MLDGIANATTVFVRPLGRILDPSAILGTPILVVRRNFWCWNFLSAAFLFVCMTATTILSPSIMNISHLLSFDSFRRAIEQHPVISFDIFDTLLVRKSTILPSDLFYYVARQRGFSHADAMDFHRRRLRAEEAARQRQLRQHGHLEVSLSDIYREAEIAGGPITSADELALETLHLDPRPVMARICALAREGGKKIYAISDMYLSADTLKEILAEKNIPVDGVFSSADWGGGKYNQMLYAAFLEQTGLAPGDILHFGDNEHADFKQAIACGIHAIHIPKTQDCLFLNTQLNQGVLERMNHHGSFFSNALLAYVSRHQESKGFSSAAQVFGAMYAAPMVFLFTAWLNREAKRRNITRLALMSRDGFVVKRTLDILFPENPHPVFLCSRRCLLMASAYRDQNSWDFLFENTEHKPAREVIESLSLDQAGALIAWLVKAGIDPATQSLFALPSKKQREFLAASRQLAMPQIAEEWKNTQKQMAALGIGQPETALVDVGWGLTSHKAIEVLLGKPVAGFYVGTSWSAPSHPLIQAFLFSQGKDTGWNKVFLHGVELLELCFAASERPLIALRDSGPVYRPTDFLESVRNQAAEEIRAEVLAFARHAHELRLGADEIDRDKNLLKKIFVHLCDHPTPMEYHALGGIAHDRLISGVGVENIAHYWRTKAFQSGPLRQLSKTFIEEIRLRGGRSAVRKARSFIAGKIIRR